MRVLAVTNLYPTLQNPHRGTFIEQQIQGLRRAGLEVDVLVVDRDGKGVCAYLGLGKVLRFRIAAFQPEIVHVMYGGVLAEIVTRVVTDRPVVVSFCGTDLLGGSYFRHFRWLTVQYDVFSSRLAAKRADGIVVKSKNLRSALPKGTDLNRVWVIPNGVDLSRFQPFDRLESRRKLGWEEDTFHILTTAYPGHVRKKLELAEETVARLRQDGITVELHQLHRVPHKEVSVWLNASDALLLTSIHEGSPNIIKEALACNRPVVSTDVGDVRERIEEVEGCYLSRPDPAALAAKLRLVFNGPHWIEGSAKMQELSLERVAHRLNDFYMTLLDGVEGSQQTHNGTTFPSVLETF